MTSFSSITISRAIVAIVLLSSTFAQAEDQPKDNVLSCTWPVMAGDTAATIKARFGEEAVTGDVPGAEGEVMQGVILFPNDSTRKLNVFFFDDEMTQISLVQPDYGVESWTAAGISIGMTMEELLAANGGPFEFYGFDWDYGGYITDFKGGNLDQVDGGCRLGVRIEPSRNGELPTNLIGDTVVSSAAEGIVEAAPVVTEISLGWAISE